MPPLPLLTRASLRMEVVRFLAVGVANFMLTFVVFTVMLRWASVDPSVSLLAAWLIGLLFSYVMNFSWVFKTQKTLKFNFRFRRYFFASAVSIIFNVVALELTVRFAHLDALYAQLCLVPLVVVFNFTTAKFWSLSRSRDDRSI